MLPSRRPASTGHVPSNYSRVGSASEPLHHRQQFPDGRSGKRRMEGQREGMGLPQPPGFVLYVDTVLRWLGVEGVTPEVLRRAKRGLREPGVAAKMWRALLRVSLLHLDALNAAEKEPTRAYEPNPEPASGSFPGPVRDATTDRRRLRQHPRHSPLEEGTSSGASDPLCARARETVQRRSTKEELTGTDCGVNGLSSEVAAATAGFLLRQWGYRRRAFHEIIQTGDLLQTREILLALAWLLAEARVFNAYERALLDVRDERGKNEEERTRRANRIDLSHALQLEFSPQVPRVNPTDEKRGANGVGSQMKMKPPPRFPRDVSETTEYANVAGNAFVQSLRVSGSATQNWAENRRQGGRGGRKRVGGVSREAAEEGLTLALAAARELMSCYGRLESELRLLHGLEAARQKMLRRMSMLHADLHAEPLPTDGSRNAVNTPTRVGKRGDVKSSPPVTRKLESQRSKRSSTTPFCLCLLARSEREQMGAFAEVSKARKALERREKGSAYRGQWSKWIMSAITDQATTAPYNTLASKSISSDGSGMAMSTAVRPGENPNISGRTSQSGSRCRSSKPAPGMASSDAGVVSTGGSLLRVKQLQEILESRLLTVGSEIPPSPSILPELLADMEARTAEVSPTNSHAVLASDQALTLAAFRRTANEVNTRLGVIGILQALEREVNETVGSGLHLRDSSLSCDKRVEQCDQAGKRAPDHHDKSPPAFGAPVLSSRASPGSSSRTSFKGDLHGDSSKAHCTECSMDKYAEFRWAKPEELATCRRLNRDRLKSLLSSCVGVMPLLPRGAGF